VDDSVTVADLKKLLEPMFDAMLHDHERAALSYHLEQRVGEQWLGDKEPLGDDDVVGSTMTWVRWEVLDEEGGSASLDLDGSPEELVEAVQSDLQDFIAETSFAWGELRQPRTQP
jgi:hypothetical protein